MNALKLIPIVVASAAVLALTGCSSFDSNGKAAEITSVNPDGTTSSAVQTHTIAGQSSFSGTDTLNGYPSSGPYASQISGLPKSIQFGFDKFTISSTAATQLKQNVAFLLQHPDVHVMLAGNTDPRGSQEYNFHLGQKRADAVQRYMLEQGVAASQMCTVSYGELKPAASPSQFGGNWQKAYSLDRRTDLFYGQTCGGSHA